MIIQSLVALYERLATSGDAEQRLPEPGWKENEIAFVIDLDRDGNLIDLVPLLQPQQKGRPRGRMSLVPQEVKRPGKVPDEATDGNCWQASLCWDAPQWALGISKRGDAKSEREALVRQGQFRLRQAKFARDAGSDVANDAGMIALLRFLDRGAASALPAEQKAEIQASSGNVAFRLDGDLELICRRPAIRSAVSASALAGDDSAAGQCLVTGRMARIARLHPSIQGVAGAQSSGASIVSFNLPAFESYGLAQGENAPVSDYAAFAYTTTLNFLLRHGSRFRARAGATTAVFWADERRAGLEERLQGLTQAGFLAPMLQALEDPVGRAPMRRKPTRQRRNWPELIAELAQITSVPRVGRHGSAAWPGDRCRLRDCSAGYASPWRL